MNVAGTDLLRIHGHRPCSTARAAYIIARLLRPTESQNRPRHRRVEASRRLYDCTSALIDSPMRTEAARELSCRLRVLTPSSPIALHVEDETGYLPFTRARLPSRLGIVFEGVEHYR